MYAGTAEVLVKPLTANQQLTQTTTSFIDLDTEQRIASSTSVASIAAKRMRFHGDPRAAIADLQRYIDLGGDAPWRDEAERQIATLLDDLKSDGQD